jgi:hypothetical protein
MSALKKNRKRGDKRLLEMCAEISRIYQESPQSIPKEDLKDAASLVSIFENQQFGESFRNIKEMKKQLFDDCLLDIAGGGELLRTGIFQICFRSNQLEVSHRFFGDPTSGDLVYSVSLKKQAAFQNFKQTEADEIPQDQINKLSLYFACARTANFKI